MDVREKLEILADAAKYDASCASSGSKGRRAAKGGVGSTEGLGICHSYTPDGRCVSLLKILLTNYCVYDCGYCINRRSSGVRRARFTPEEVVSLTLTFYKRNYIEGLFLSSGIIRGPDYTMEQLVRVARTLRLEHGFAGYIHLKTIPNAAPELLAEAGRWADRLSMNVELPRQQDLDRLAPEKELVQIGKAMAVVKERIDESREFSERSARVLGSPAASVLGTSGAFSASAGREPSTLAPAARAEHARRSRAENSLFAPAGQSTQMIVGATEATDATILDAASALYRGPRLRRVYYSAFSPIPDASSVLPPAAPPLLREHRLYQADWLMRFYGFGVHELTTPTRPNLSLDVDPKLAWALRNRAAFPVNLNTCDREMLLRVPGLGVRSVKRIIEARRWRRLRVDDLVRLRVPLARVLPFVETVDHVPRGLEPDSVDLRRRIAPDDQIDLFAVGVSAVSGEL